MARGIKCTARLRWNHWNRGGYAEVMNSAPVQALAAKLAGELAARCNAGFVPRKGDNPAPYVARQWKGVLSKGYVVSVDGGGHPYFSELKHNRLLRSLGGA